MEPSPSHLITLPPPNILIPISDNAGGSTLQRSRSLLVRPEGRESGSDTRLGLDSDEDRVTRCWQLSAPPPHSHSDIVSDQTSLHTGVST